MKNVPRRVTAEIAEIAEIALLCGLCVLCGLSVAFAAPPAKTMYVDAMDRERAVRAAMMASDAAATAVLADVHAVVTAYEALVRHYPASGYSDNALWQAGRLSLDAYDKFGQARDRDKGVRLLRQLEAVYVTSKLAKKVPDELARANDRPVATRGREPSGSPVLRHADGVPSPSTDETLGLHPASTRTATATIRSIQRAVLPDAVRVTIELDGEVPFHDERIGDPDRVFVDLAGARAAPPLVDQTLRFTTDADVVRQIRIGRHPNNTTRVVLDAADIASYSVYPLYDPYRLVIDCVRTSAVSGFSRTLPARLLALPLLRRAPSTTPRAASLIADSVRAHLSPVARPQIPVIVDNGPVTAIAPPVTPPAKNLGGGFSIARQLGLGVSRIVIDAGHGGHDPGAKGKGITEAELVLDVALRLEKLIQRTEGMEAILTRRTDEFVPLQERTLIANREGADLFLSIHANASRTPQARGVETYFLNFANNLSAAAVAARENAASGQAMGALPDIVKAIALNNKLDESRDFAALVQHAMVERLRPANKTVKDLGVKQAPFVVLIGAAMPSVLAEISFVTNTQEARLLKSSAYRQRIAEALFTAIKKYQASLRVPVAVAHQ